ncbi:uncharacterized protein [Rhodnius prolixus]|uniref:uncharacterized protein n=1 Tax=Rhodnius prolixus TaxID=13249 RepID=UPI003D18F21D
MPVTDMRGRLIVEMAARTELVVLNEGSTSTFRRPGYTETIPDISLASEGLAARVRGWRVIEDFTGSDHQYITFNIGFERNSDYLGARTAPAAWNLARLNEEVFQAVLTDGKPQVELVQSEEDVGAEVVVATTMELISEACRQSMPKKAPWRGRRPVYWWTTHIADLRKICI